MQKTMEPYKMFHVRLHSGGTEAGLETLAGQPGRSAASKKQAFTERAKHFFSRLFGGLLCICFSLGLVVSGVYLITFPGANGALFVILGLLLLFGLGMFSLMQLLPLGFRMIGLALGMMAPAGNRDIKRMAQKYRAAMLDWDWGRLHSLTAPQAANGLTVKELKKAWRSFQTGNGIHLPAPMLEKLKAALDAVRQSASCHTCGAEKNVYRSGLLWLYKGEDTPFSLIECPDCGAVYCRECIGRLADGKCAQCGADLKARNVGMLYQDRARISLRYLTDSKTGQRVHHKSVIKDTAVCAVKLLDMQWEGAILLEDPLPVPAGAKKASDNKPSKYSDLYACTIHFPMHTVSIRGKWYMAQALPPDDLTIDWEYIDGETVAPAAKKAGAEMIHTASTYH